MLTGEEIVKIAEKHGANVELGAQYSVKCQIAQLINAVEECSYRQAPCKNACESKAFEIEIKNLKSEVKRLEKDISDWNDEFLV